jgi:hypothetical protein
LDAGWTIEFAPDLKRLGLQEPFLSMNGTVDPNPGEPGYPAWLLDTKALFTNANKDAFWLQIKDSTHTSFDDRGSVLNDDFHTSDPTPASRAHAQTIRACLVSFFDKYLKDRDDHLFDNPSAVSTNIFNFQKK